MKKILSIDGGGIRGVIPARVLQYIEEQTGKPISQCFDLMAGTSTGGILALGLAKNKGDGTPAFSAKKLKDIYRKHGKKIFSRSLWKGVSSAGGLLDELYSHEGLEEVLDEYFGDAALGSALTDVLITTYDIQQRTPLFLKSWKDKFEYVKMKDAARATSAAPTYFEPALVPIRQGVRALVDGGVFINSPAVSAYAQARKISPGEQDFLVLSLGTGELNRPIEFEDAKSWGKVGWLVPLLGCMFDGVSDAVDYQLRAFLGEDRYFRMQTTLEVASDDMDNATAGNIANLEAEADKLLEVRKKGLDAVCELILKDCEAQDR